MCLGRIQRRCNYTTKTICNELSIAVYGQVNGRDGVEVVDTDVERSGAVRKTSEFQSRVHGFVLCS